MSLFGDNDLIYDDEVGSDDWFPEEGGYDIPDNGLAEPRHSTICIGHDDKEKLFLELYEKSVFPHALIFSGQEGIGKTTMAFRLARFLLKHGKEDAGRGGLFGGDDIPQEITTLDVPSDDPVFSRVASGGHADLLHIARNYDEAKGKQDATLKVEALRKIEPFLRKTSSEGGWRIVLIEDADTMNRNAQNAILKILEEPPANVLIILIAHRPGMLIPTIRSRARVITFDPLSTENMKDLLARQGVTLSSQDTAALADLSEGSIGHALKYAEEGGLDMMQKILGYLDIAPNWNWEEIHKLANSLGTAAKDPEYRLFNEMLQWVFRKMLFLKSRGVESLPVYLDQAGCRRIYESYTIEKFIDICDALKKHFARTEFANLDRRDAVRTAFDVING